MSFFVTLWFSSHARRLECVSVCNNFPCNCRVTKHMLNLCVSQLIHTDPQLKLHKHH